MNWHRISAMWRSIRQTVGSLVCPPRKGPSFSPRPPSWWCFWWWWWWWWWWWYWFNGWFGRWRSWFATTWSIAPKIWADHYHKSSHQSHKRNLAVEWWVHYSHWQFVLLTFTTPCGDRSLVPKITSSDFDDGIPLDELPEYWPRCFVTRNESIQSRWRCQMVNVACHLQLTQFPGVFIPSNVTVTRKLGRRLEPSKFLQQYFADVRQLARQLSHPFLWPTLVCHGVRGYF